MLQLSILNSQFSILLGWLLDLVFGDPVRLPHPVVWFGKAIAAGEKRLNRGRHRAMKGALLSVTLIAGTFVAVWLVRKGLLRLGTTGTWLTVAFDAMVVFYCLAGTTLIREVRATFHAVDRSLEEGRRQVARIVGRDTATLSAQEVRTAALETLAENLSDGVVAPLFWLALLGTPGMMAYKMVNTLDSMIGYRTERYKAFGCVAARIDDVANFIPARLTALLMVLPHAILNFQLVRHAHHKSIFTFLRRYGRAHASPNSGWPEAALAGILDCRFGGPHDYFGQLFDKPYIGENDRPLTTDDMRRAVRINRWVEVAMVGIVGFVNL